MQKRGRDIQIDRTSSLRLAAVAWPFVAIIIIQVVLATFSLQLVTTLRAYVAGESHWSKAQHNAIYYLNRYIDTGEVSFLRRYELVFDVPMGDRDARLALEQQPPDRQAAFDGFLRGRNSPTDIAGLIWLFENFSWFSYMQEAVSHWRAAEPLLMQLEVLKDEVIAAPGASLAERRAWKAQLDSINNLVTPLTEQFSTSLGNGARFVQAALLAANFLIATLFIILTLWRLNSFVRRRRAVEGELAWRAMHDQLTKLPNRAAFEKVLGESLADGSATALMFIDLDRFKQVNDTAGHAAGDRLLCAISDVLTLSIDEDDLAARLGGDEFGVIVRGSRIEHALATAHRLRSALADLPFLWKDAHFTISASIGFVALGQVGETVQSATIAADQACYRAKQSGRNRVFVHGAIEVPVVPEGPQKLSA
jgi:diguanylate cyclase (GGDEF)-like protein